MTDQNRARWATLRAGDRVRISDRHGQSLFVDIATVSTRLGLPTLVYDEHGDVHSSDTAEDVRLLRRPLLDAMTEFDLPAGVTLATIWNEEDDEPVFELTDGKRTYRAVFHWEHQILHLEVTRWYDGGAFEIGKYVVTPLGLVYMHGDLDAIRADEASIRAAAFWLYDKD